MANRKVLLDPSKWVVDGDHKVSLRYRVVTNDFNIRSAFSPVYRIQVPEKADIFSSVVGAATTEVVDDNVIVRLSWSTAPVYNNFNYYIFLKKPGESDYSFIKSTQNTSFSYVVTTDDVGTYDFIVSMPTTTKTPLTNARLLLASTTI